MPPLDIESSVDTGDHILLLTVLINPLKLVLSPHEFIFVPFFGLSRGVLRKETLIRVGTERGLRLLRGLRLGLGFWLLFFVGLDRLILIVVIY